MPEAEKKDRYLRLHLLEYAQLLEEEVTDFSDIIRAIVDNDVDDFYLESILYKLKSLEKDLHSIVKMI